jgi:hypothetical protein
MAKKAVKATDQKGSAAQALLIPKLASKAISKDVGPMVIKGLAEAKRKEDEANLLEKEVASKRYDMLSHLTQGIVKAAKGDGQIDLSVAYQGGPDGVKAMGQLNDYLGLALGFKEVVTINAGTPQEMKRIVWAKAVQPYVIATKEEKGTAEGNAKESFRSNFSHLLKKCARAACTIIDNKIDAKIDKKTNTLLISGPAVKSLYGAPSVLLDEKQTVGEGDKAVKLNERPSFQSLANKGAEKHGATVKGGSNTRGGKVTAPSNPAEALMNISNSFLSFIGKVDVAKLDDKTRKTLTDVRDKLDAILD